jgi:two-component system CheB/CheR fusion protein
VNRRGHRIEVRVLGSPLAGYDGRPGGVILMMEQGDGTDGSPDGSEVVGAR